MNQLFDKKQVSHLYDTIISYIAHQESILTYCVNQLQDMGLDTLLDYYDEKFNTDKIVEVFNKNGLYNKLTLKGNWTVNRAFKDDKYHLIIKSDKDIHKYMGYEVWTVLEVDGRTYKSPLVNFEFTITGNIRPYDRLDEDTLAFTTKEKAINSMLTILNK